MFVFMIGDVDTEKNKNEHTGDYTSRLENEDKVREDLYVIFKWANESNMNFNNFDFVIIRHNPTISPKPRSCSLEGREYDIAVSDLRLFSSNGMNFITLSNQLTKEMKISHSKIGISNFK